VGLHLEAERLVPQRGYALQRVSLERVGAVAQRCCKSLQATGLDGSLVCVCLARAEVRARTSRLRDLRSLGGAARD
jgi:hypothetical protein